MADTKEKFPPLRNRFSHRAKRVLQLLALLMATIVIAFTIAHWAINHSQESTALRDWMNTTRYSWLVWRFALYVSLGWGFWKVWHTPGCKPEYRAPLKRMVVATAVFILACEYSLFGGGLLS